MSEKPTYEEIEKRIAELEAESSARKSAEEALLRSEALLNKSQSIAQIGSWELDLTKNRLFWSDEVYRIFGLHPQEFEATYEAFIDTVHPDDRASVDAAYTGSLREGKDTYEIEHRIVRRDDGEIHIVHEKCEHVRDTSGRIVGSIGMVQDITERKHSEQLLKESEARLGSIIRVAPIGIGVVTDRVFQTVNDKLCEMTGFSKEELVGRSARVIYPSDDDFERVGRDKYADIKKHGLGTIETRFKRKNGIIIDILLSSTPLVPKDLSKGVTFTALDITERKKAETALSESEEKYRLLIENIPSVTWITSENGETTFISSNVEKVYGFSQEEIREKGDELWFRRIHPDDIDKVRESFKSMFAEGKKFDVEYRVQRKDGNWIWLSDKAIIAYEQEGVKYAFGIFSDITERKQAEEALQKSAVIIEETSDSVITTDIDGNITFWNKGAERIYGYQEGEVLGKPISIIYKDEDLPILDSIITDLLDGKDIPSIEVTCIDKSRNDIHILLSLTSLKDKDGNITELIGITKEITERKMMEESLRQERDKAQKLFDIAGVMFVAIDTKGEVTLINQKGSEILGYKQEESIGKNWFDRFLPASIRDETKTVFERLMAGDTEPVEYFENPVVTKIGEERLIAWHNTVLKDDRENIIGTLSSGEDITDRRRAEEALKESEKKYKELADSLPQIVFETDIEGSITYASRISFDLFGYTQQDFDQGLKALQMLIPEDRKKALDDINRVLNGEKLGGKEYTALRKDVSTFPVVIHSNRIVRDGKPIGLRGIIVDLSKLKQAEDALRESSTRLRSILDSVQAGIIIVDAERHEIVEANLAAVEMIGDSKDKIIGSLCHKYICPAEIGNCPITDLGQKVDHSERLLLKGGSGRIPILKTFHYNN